MVEMEEVSESMERSAGECDDDDDDDDDVDG